VELEFTYIGTLQEKVPTYTNCQYRRIAINHSKINRFFDVEVRCVIIYTI